MKKWKLKEIVIGKTFELLILTILLSASLRYLTKLVWMKSDIHKSYVIYLQILMAKPFVFLVLSFIISLLIMKIILSLRTVSNKGKRSRQIVINNEKKFKWHIAFSIVIGYILLRIFCKITGIFIFSLIPAIILARRIHKAVAKCVGTNRELIEALEKGELNAELPRKLRTQRAIKGIADMLREPAAITLEGAIVEYCILWVLLNIILPIIAFITGVVSFVVLFGIDNLNLSNDDFVQALSVSFAIGIFIPFDIVIALCAIVAFLIRKICKKRDSKGRRWINVGMIMSIVCLIISATPVGDALPMISYAIFNSMDMLMGEGDGRIAKEGDYSLENLRVTYSSEDSTAFAFGAGTITNTSEYDWESVTIGVRLLDAEGGYGKYDGAILECKLHMIPSGGSANFQTGTYAVNGTVEYGSFASCEVVSVKYNIDSRTHKTGYK